MVFLQFLLVGIGAFLLVGSLFAFLSYLKWTDNKALVNKLYGRNWQVFDDLNISSIRYFKIGSKIGFSTKGKALVTDETIVLAASSMTLFLFQSHLPVIIPKSKTHDLSIKMNMWNSITIEIQESSGGFFSFRTEYLLETKDKEQKIKLYERLTAGETTNSHSVRS